MYPEWTQPVLAMRPFDGWMDGHNTHTKITYTALNPCDCTSSVAPDRGQFNNVIVTVRGSAKKFLLTDL